MTLEYQVPFIGPLINVRPEISTSHLVVQIGHHVE